MDPQQQRSAPAHASACARLSWHDHVPTGHEVLPGLFVLCCALGKQTVCTNMTKGTAKEIKRTRWAVDNVFLDIKLTPLNCSEDAISLLAILRSEYLVIVIEEVLG